MRCLTAQAAPAFARRQIPEARLGADAGPALLAVIGLIGFAFERLVFGALERGTVQRWGMVRAAKG
jgi:hypothetical protein